MELQIGNVTLPLDGVDIDTSGGTVVVTERVNGYRLTISQVDRVYVWQQSLSDENGWNPYSTGYTYDEEALTKVVQDWYTGVLWLLSGDIVKRKRPTALLCNRRRTTFRTMRLGYRVITIYQWVNIDGGYEKVARRIVTKDVDGKARWVATIIWSPGKYVTRTTKRGAAVAWEVGS